MAGIQDLIATATRVVGVSDGAASAGVGGLLAVLRSKLGGQFGKIEEAIPGAEALAKATPGNSPVMGMIGSLLGKGPGTMGAVACRLAKSGIAPGKVQSFLKVFVDFLKSKLPPDVMKSIAEKVPALKGLVG